MATFPRRRRFHFGCARARASRRTWCLAARDLARCRAHPAPSTPCMRRRSAGAHPKWSGSCPSASLLQGKLAVPAAAALRRIVKERPRPRSRCSPSTADFAPLREPVREPKKCNGPVPFGDRACRAYSSLEGVCAYAPPSPGGVGSSMCAGRPKRFDVFVHWPPCMTLPPADADGAANARTTAHRPRKGRVLARMSCAFMMRPERNDAPLNDSVHCKDSL